MRVGLAKIEMIFPYAQSLKEKRFHLRKIKDKTFAKFKVSVSEVDYHDKWQRSLLGLSVCGNDAVVLSSLMDKVINFIEDTSEGEMVDSLSEVISF